MLPVGWLEPRTGIAEVSAGIPTSLDFFQAFFFAAALFVTSTVMIFTFKSGKHLIYSHLLIV